MGGDGGIAGMYRASGGARPEGKGMKLAFEDIVLNGIRNAVEEGGLCGPKPPMSTRRVLAGSVGGW